MASHVVVIDATMKRTTVKTTPTKHLSDVLTEACSKLGLKPENYTLKHDNKQVDLSRTMRLSGLNSGAKLNLVQASRSPSVVSVALQLPNTGDSSGNLARLTDKFPSNTSIWQILRRFEAGAAGASSSRNLNFTQRATPQTTSGKVSGGGRLCYEMPVVNVMGRDLASLVDLQKTLNQIGFNSGSCLLRLSFRNTQQPLEEAMAEISQYFQETEEPAPAAQSSSSPPPTEPPTQTQSSSSLDAPESSEATETTATGDTTSAMSIDTPTTTNSDIPSADAHHSQSLPSSEISIFAPPSSSTPAAASQTTHNESDYIPSVAHAQLHQARLATESQNKRLKSDAELAAQEESRAATRSSIREVTVRFRFPDQSQAQRSYDQTATTADLYSLCREVMDRPSGEAFTVRIVGGKASTETLTDAKAPGTRLIRDLGWQGRVLVTVVWADDVPADRRRKPALKKEYRQKAETMKVDLPQSQDDPEEHKKSSTTSAAQSKSQSGSGTKQDKETKLKGFLKGLSKK